MASNLKIPGLFLVLFMALSCVMGLFYLKAAVTGTGAPAMQELIKGTWPPRFEKTLGEKLPVYDPSRNFWGASEYAMFGQGRKGVIVGKNGWLFTDEEFSCPRGGVAAMQENLGYMKNVREKLQAKNVRLAVVLVPAKTRVYPEYIGSTAVPHCRAGIYEDAAAFLKQNNIQVVELLNPMLDSANKEALYLKTDTHWTPEGAKFAAHLTAQNVTKPSGADKIFLTQPGTAIKHSGDLLRYLPSVKEIAPDDLHQAVTEQNADTSSSSLFDEDVPPITLVGTSYSANKLWNFDGFLKEAFNADILNAADEGQGPFTVMEKYLADDAWKNSPPQLILWEVPERYMTTKIDYSKLEKKENVAPP